MKKNDNKRKKTDKKPFFDKKRKKKVIEIDEELDNVREVVVERDSGFNTIEVMVIILISVLFGIVIGCILNSTKSIGKEVSNEASEIITTYNAILENYYDEVDPSELADAAVSGMIGVLDDPYSVYMNSNDTDSFLESVNGSFVGIGVTVEWSDNKFKIVEIFNNSPAQAAKLEVNDYIIKVDGKSVKDLNIDELSKLLKGKSGSKVNVNFDIPTLYSQTIKDYAMKPLYRNLIDSLRIASGEEVVQNSFDLYEKEWNDSADPHAGYNLTEKVEWKNVLGPSKVEIEGRSIGGCLDCVKSYIGTKYDKVTEYIERHKENGIIWFLEAFEMNTAELQRTLWQMKSAGYFKYCRGIVFGRPLFIREDYETSFNEAVRISLEDLNIPVICDVDIGHVSPQIATVNGAILKITSEDGKGKVETYLR